MSSYSTSPSFLDSSLGKIFAIQYLPDSEVLGTVILVPPFAEEMNKCRPMMTRQARQLAGLGFCSVVFDLFGTGDSEGLFGEASWSDWVADLRSVVNSINVYPERPIWLIGIRLGALLLLDALRQDNIRADGIILWNAVANGKTHMNQFLRLKLASDLTAASGQRQSVQGLRENLVRDRTIEVAGYDLNYAMVAAVDSIEFHALLKPAAKIWMLETSESASPTTSPAARRVAERAGEDGVTINLEAIDGPPFWATQEIAIAPNLIERTCQIIAGVT